MKCQTWPHASKWQTSLVIVALPVQVLFMQSFELKGCMVCTTKRYQTQNWTCHRVSCSPSASAKHKPPVQCYWFVPWFDGPANNSQRRWWIHSSGMCYVCPWHLIEDHTRPLNGVQWRIAEIQLCSFECFLRSQQTRWADWGRKILWIVFSKCNIELPCKVAFITG